MGGFKRGDFTMGFAILRAKKIKTAGGGKSIPETRLQGSDYPKC